jgi:hypothetical protein
MEPRKAIGSVSFSELLVALAASLGFFMHLDQEQIDWGPVGALLLGAVIVAPFAAYIVKILAPRVLGTFVGGLIVVLNARTIMVALDVPSVARVLLLVLLGLGSAALVWRSWTVVREEAALQALVPTDDHAADETDETDEQVAAAELDASRGRPG